LSVIFDHLFVVVAVGGIDVNETLRNETYQFLVYYVPDNDTWVADMEIVATTPDPIYNHGFEAVTFPNEKSMLIIFGGSYDEFDNGTDSDLEVITRRLYTLDLAKPVLVWEGPFFMPDSPLATTGHGVMWNPWYRQLWVVGGMAEPNSVYMLDIDSKNMTDWKWRFGPNMKAGAYEFDLCVIKNPRTGVQQLFKFGGSVNEEVSIGVIEFAPFYPVPGNFTGRPGRLVIPPTVPQPPPPPPPPPVTVATVVGNITTIILVTVDAPSQTPTIMPSSSTSSTAAIPSSTGPINIIEEYTGLGLLGQTVAFGVIGIVVFLMIMACIVRALKKKSRKKKRPAKTNFYSL
jgi:hypothetical protein